MKATTAQAILEEVLYRAIRGAREAEQSDYGEGLVMAYYDIADVIKEQADLLGLQWTDKALADFDPDSLLREIGSGKLKNNEET